MSKLFGYKESDRENYPVRLPAGTRDRIAEINKALQAMDHRMTFELNASIEEFVERALKRAEDEVKQMQAAIAAKQEDEPGEADDAEETAGDGATDNDKPGNPSAGSGAASTAASGAGPVRPATASASANS